MKEKEKGFNPYKREGVGGGAQREGWLGGDTVID